MQLENNFIVELNQIQMDVPFINAVLPLQRKVLFQYPNTIYTGINFNYDIDFRQNEGISQNFCCNVQIIWRDKKSTI